MDADIARVRATYRSGKTHDIAWRREQLQGILRMVRAGRVATGSTRVGRGSMGCVVRAVPLRPRRSRRRRPS